MSDVTRILSQIAAGDPAAAEQLLPLVYDELRRLAAARLAHEKPGQTLQATALVHEAYLRLAFPTRPAGTNPSDDGNAGARPGGEAHWNSRNHFFSAAAEAMRRILVESARRKAARKHGGDLARQPLLDSEIAIAAPPDEVLAVHEALDQLERADANAAKLVKLHYFGGFSLEEAGEVVGLSRTKAYRTWTYARTWLRAHLPDPGKPRGS